MRKGQIKEHLSVEEIQKRMVESMQKKEFQRWQVIYLIKTKGFNAKQIGEMVGISPRTVHQWTYYYNKYGEIGLVVEGSGGRRRMLMSWEEEKALLDNLVEDATRGLIVIVHGLKKRVEEKIGKKVSKDYTYDLLHRHGWRKIVPRPSHPKRNKVKQEEYKKNFLSWWPPLYQAIHRKIQDL